MRPVAWVLLAFQVLPGKQATRSARPSGRADRENCEAVKGIWGWGNKGFGFC